jgi:DNA-binding SARP family transcriptional activator
MLRVRVLGELTVEEDGRALEPPGSRRAWALLGWLAMHPGLHPRADVAARFWPDVLDSSARQSLRNALWELRRALGTAGAVVVAERDRVGLDPACGTWVDAADFSALLAAGRGEEAVALCRGDLLAGIDDAWAVVARGEHQDRLAQALRDLADSAAVAGDRVAALGWARRAVALDPRSEDATRLLMRGLAEAGDLPAALSAYSRLRDRLARELRVAPSSLTRALVDELRAAAPVEARSEAGVAARSQGASLSRRGCETRLIGREVELATLLGAWDAARSGTGEAVLISGPPGIGKTRLADELGARAAADGAIVAVCQAVDIGAAAPLSLWAELVGALVRALPEPPDDVTWPEDLALLVPALARAGRTRSTAALELERTRLNEAAVACLEWAATAAPLLLVLEDVHAADAPSLALVAYAARRLAGMSVLVVLTRRNAPRRAEVDALQQALRARGVLGSELALAPLDSTAATRLVRATAALADADVQRIVAAVEGHPLLAVESARALAGGERSLPRGLRGAVRVTLNGLSEPARELAYIVAVAGRQVAGAELRAFGLDPASVLAGAIDAGLLTGDEGELTYRHALLRDAVYAELPEHSRTPLHARWGAVLAGRGDPARAAEAAHHLRRAHDDTAAVAQLVGAARHALSVGALREAAAYQVEAVALAPEDPELALELAAIEAARGRPDAASAAFSGAVARMEAAGDPLALAQAHLRFAEWHYAQICLPRVAAEASRHALAVLEGAGLTAVSEHDEALAIVAFSEALLGDPAIAEAMAERLAPGPDASDEAIYRHERTVSLALIRAARFSESYPSGIVAGEAGSRLGRPDLAYVAWINIAGAAVCAGDLERALAIMDRCGETLRGKGLPVLEVHGLLARCSILARQGRAPEAREAVIAARGLAARIGADDLVAAADDDRARVELAAGNYAEATDRFEAALTGSGPFSRALARLGRAEALVRLERADDAERELRETVLEPVTPGDWPDTLVARLTRVQGLIALARGDRDMAVRRLTEAADGWRRHLGSGHAGERWTATLADIGRPVVGVVAPALELDLVLADLNAVQEPIADAHV